MSAKETKFTVTIPGKMVMTGVRASCGEQAVHDATRRQWDKCEFVVEGEPEARREADGFVCPKCGKQEFEGRETRTTDKDIYRQNGVWKKIERAGACMYGRLTCVNCRLELGDEDTEIIYNEAGVHL